MFSIACILFILNNNEYQLKKIGLSFQDIFRQVHHAPHGQQLGPS